MSQFVYRTLKESEQKGWFEHCGLVFQRDKQYFIDHWACDPWANIDAIFVCIDESNNDAIASTVRVFRRTIYLHGEKALMGGIGEVSTKEQYRSQGHAKKLLQMANDYMRENNFAVSLLSASKKNIPFYGLFGYLPISEYETKFVLTRSTDTFCSTPTPTGSDVTLVPLKFTALEQSAQERLMSLYEAAASKFSGPVSRSEAYWARWVPAWDESDANHWEAAVYERGALLGYVAFSKKISDTRGMVARIEEAVLDEALGERRKDVLLQCFKAIARDYLPAGGDEVVNKDELIFSFRSSMFLNHDALAQMPEKSSQQHEYSGWMYQFLASSGTVNSEFEKDFLFYGIDAF